MAQPFTTEQAPAKRKRKRCPRCNKAIHGHPNKRFCRQKCKDRYHNAKGNRTRDVEARRFRDEYPVEAYHNEIHPFSSEAFEE